MERKCDTLVFGDVVVERSLSSAGYMVVVVVVVVVVGVVSLPTCGVGIAEVS